MANARYGKNILGELSDAQTLPNAGTEDSENMVFVGYNTGGSLWINLYANTDITIASGQTFSVEFQAHTADDASNADSIGSKDNNGGIGRGSGTSMEEFHTYLIDKTASDGELTWSAGDLMFEFGIPEEMLRLRSLDYVQLVYLTDANEETEKVDAFVYVKPA